MTRLQQRGAPARAGLVSFVCAVAVALAAPPLAGADDSSGPPPPSLEGRAVLDVATLAPGPPAGAFVTPNPQGGFTFPRPSQPVEGFSAVIDGRRPGEYLAMPDNGFGGKANSVDFLIRAYYVTPDFKTAQGGTGAVAVGPFISFRDPDHRMDFGIVNEMTDDRLLTGGDIDPESLQRAKSGDLWMGDEFGPWILHFDAEGVLLDPPFPMPGNLQSPNNPFLVGPATHPNSRGIEAMAISPNGKYLYAALEGPTVADTDKRRRHIFEFSIADEAFTGATWEYHTESVAFMVADIDALDGHRFVAIERDGGRGENANFRSVYVVDLRYEDAEGFLEKRRAVDLTNIADPALVSLPAVHPGDIGLGGTFRVVCESIEAIHVLDGERLLLGCDNNFPNSGRNPGLADDNEFIVVKAPGLQSRHSTGGTEGGT
ncbi:MAG: esterase-like activity of phytase family protein [Acidimicrobiales bacterium]